MPALFFAIDMLLAVFIHIHIIAIPDLDAEPVHAAPAIHLAVPRGQLEAVAGDAED